MIETGRSVKDFISQDTIPRRQPEAFALVKLFQEVSEFKPKMWGPSIIGFGKIKYRYESGHGGEMPVVAFSPRKASLVFYLAYEFDQREELLKQLGKVKTSKACIYVNKLADINLSVLKKMIRLSIKQTLGKK